MLERPTNMFKPSPFDPGIPPMPKGLDGYARAEWRRLVSHLSEKGVLCPADISILQVTSQAYSELMRWIGTLKKYASRNPHGRRPRRKPDVDMQPALLNTYLRCLEECTVPPPDHIHRRTLPTNVLAPARNASARGAR